VRPRILVLEGLSGSGLRVTTAGGDPIRGDTYDLDDAFDTIFNETWEGMLLTGGGDVNPAMYNRKPHANVYGVDENRDWIEVEALREARRLNRPVLGICRGAQIMSVESGGVLRQHIRGHYGNHPVVVKPGSLLHKAAGDLRPTVKSLHHQEVKNLPKTGWQVSGVAPDGTVEAVETLDGRCLGVQFHPEMEPYKPASRGIFRWLVTESAKRAGLPTPDVPSAPRSGKHKVSQISWYCPFDGIKFDDRDDQKDHLEIIHGASFDATGRIVLANGSGWTDR